MSAEQRRGSLDPISGLLQLLANIAVHDSCDTTVPIFEGKRRFDISGVDVDRQYVDEEDYSAFKGDARICDAKFDMVAGEYIDRPPDRFWARKIMRKGVSRSASGWAPCMKDCRKCPYGSKAAVSGVSS